MDKFFMVYAENGQSPRVQHPTRLEAETEAMWICRANAAKGIVGNVYVLKAICFCHTSELWEEVT